MILLPYSPFWVKFRASPKKMGAGLPVAYTVKRLHRLKTG